MKKFWIFEECLIDFDETGKCFEAENEESALQMFFKAENIDEDEQWRYFANEDEFYLEHYLEEKRHDEEEEILWSRPIEL